MASQFNEDVFCGKLLRLNSTQKSIEDISQFIREHEHHASDVVTIWYRELLKARPSAKVYFIFVANDAIQKSAKSRVWRSTFTGVLPQALGHAFRAAENDDSRKAILKVLRVWRDRNVYSKEVCDSMMRTIHADPPKVKPNASATSVVHVNAPTNHPIVRAENAIEQATILDDLSSDRLQSLPPALFDESSDAAVCGDTKSITNASAVVLDMRERLTKSIALRTNLIKLLFENAKQQEQEVRAAAEKLRSCDKKLQRLQSLLSPAPTTTPSVPSVSTLQALLSPTTTTTPSAPSVSAAASITPIAGRTKTATTTTAGATAMLAVSPLSSRIPRDPRSWTPTGRNGSDETVDGKRKLEDVAQSAGDSSGKEADERKRAKVVHCAADGF